MKKNIVYLLIAFLLIGLLAGCSPVATTTSTSTSLTTGTDATTIETSATTITIAHIQGEWMWPILDELGKQWNELSGNTVEWIYVPADSNAEWQQAQFAAGNEPDALFNTVDALTYFRSGKLADLTEYYNAPNKYNGEIWKDTYLEGALDDCIDKENGNKYFAIATTGVTVNMYYNKDLLKSLGLPDDKAPESWTEVLQYCEAAANSDQSIVPFSIQNSINWNLGSSWLYTNFLEDLYVNSGILESLDIINPNGRLENNEIVLGLKSGKIKYTDPQIVAYFDYMKKLSAYFNKDFNSISWEFEGIFTSGQSLMTNNGSWFPNQVITNDIDINYLVAPMPYVDSSIYSNARNKPVYYAPYPGEAGNTVTTRAKMTGTIDEVIDFYQFMTDKNSGAKLFAEKTMFIPLVKGVGVPAPIQNIVDGLGDETYKTRLGFVIFSLNAEHDAKYFEAYQKFLSDSGKSASAFCEEMQILGDKYVDMVIAEMPEYSVIEQYIDKVK